MNRYLQLCKCGTCRGCKQRKYGAKYRALLRAERAGKWSPHLTTDEVDANCREWLEKVRAAEKEEHEIMHWGSTLSGGMAPVRALRHLGGDN